jgi:hypothetical protein
MTRGLNEHALARLPAVGPGRLHSCCRGSSGVVAEVSCSTHARCGITVGPGRLHIAAVTRMAWWQEGGL